MRPTVLRATTIINGLSNIIDLVDGWDIWVVDPNEPDNLIQLTSNGKSNKEADWVFVAKQDSDA